MSLKISIVVPIYNQENYLKRAIESVINQTIKFENVELILIDDCSTDKSADIIKDYSEKYSNIIPVFLEKNSGNAATPRNIGIKKSTTDYIMFLDPDDEYMPDFCETMYKHITENEDVDLVKCNFIQVRNDKQTYSYYFNKDINQKIIKNTDKPLKYVTIWNGIHKSSLIHERNISFPDVIGEDICFTTQEFLNINKILYLNNYFGYIYYDDENSHAKNPKTEKIKSLIKALKITKQMCENEKREDAMNIIIGQQFIGLFQRINNNKSIKIKKELLKETYNFRKTIPHIIIPSLIYRIADSLMMKKLFLITIIYLKIAPKIYYSKILYKMFN